MACHFSEPLLIAPQSEDMSAACDERHDELLPVSPTLKFHPGEPCKENPALKPTIYNSDVCFAHTMASSAEAVQFITSTADYDQRRNTELLEHRAREIATWRGTIEALVSHLREEIILLDDQRKRLERSLTALLVPESIVAECSTRRTCRTGPDMVLDSVDRVLSEEERLCKEVREVLTLLLNEANSQLESNTTCKVQLEFDWSDKTDAYRIETINVGLNNRGPVSFHPGATRHQANQSSPEHWIHYTKEVEAQGLAVLDRSNKLRERIDEEIARSVTDLRAQADRVEVTLQRNIAAAETALQEAESELNKVLNQTTTAETIHGRLSRLARQIDFSLKTAQTRLDNRSMRLRAENTRDKVQFGLLDEVKHLNEHADRIKKEMDEADATLRAIYHSRALLEDKIAVKRKTIYVDRLRCLKSRVRYPDASVLSGFLP